MKNTTHTISDVDIIRQSLNKPWLFSILVGRYEKAFLRKSMSILHSKEAAEDAVQEVFLKIYKNAQQFSEQPHASFRSWAYKILMNVCYDELARRKRRQQVAGFDFADLDQMGFVDGQTEHTPDYSYIQVVLSRMPFGLARVLQLYFFEEKSQKEIAIQEHISLSAVRSKMHRAKKNFKDILLKTI